MEYAEVLGRLPLPTLQNIAFHLGLWMPEPRGRRNKQQQEEKQKLAELLLQFYQQPTSIPGIMKNLSADEKLALEVILYMDALDNEGVRMRDAERRLGELLGNRGLAHQVCEKLTSLGLVFSTQEFWDLRYHMPDEIKAQTYQLTVQKLRRHLVPANQVETNVTDAFTVVRQMHIFLAGVVMVNPRVTNQRRFHRQDLKKIQAFFPRAYEDRLDEIVSMAIDLEFLDTDGDNIFLTDKAWSWAENFWIYQWVELVNYSLGRALYDLPNISTTHMLNLLPKLPADAFLPVADFAERLVQLAGTENEVNTHSTGSQLAQALDTLSRLGIVEAGTAPQGQVARLNPHLPTEEEPWEEKFIVQPDFEVLADQKLAPAIFWELCKIADLVDADRMSRLRLSRTSVYRAWRKGKKLPEIVEFLRQHSKFPLPQNVEVSLRDWCDEMGRIHVYRTTVIHCDQPQLAAEIKVSPRLKPYIVGQVTPQDLLVRIEDAERVLAALQKAGYLPHPTVSDTPLETE